MPPFFQAAFQVPPLPFELDRLRHLCQGHGSFRYNSLHSFQLHCDDSRLRLTLLFDAGHPTFHAFKDWVNRLVADYPALPCPATGTWPGFTRYSDDYYVRRAQRTNTDVPMAMLDHVDELVAAMRARAEAEGHSLELYARPSEALETNAWQAAG